MRMGIEFQHIHHAPGKRQVMHVESGACKDWSKSDMKYTRAITTTSNVLWRRSIESAYPERE